MDEAEEVVFVADVTKWIWGLVEEHFHGPVQIIDWCHTAQHIWEVAHVRYGKGSDAAQEWPEARLDELSKKTSSTSYSPSVLM